MGWNAAGFSRVSQEFGDIIYVIAFHYDGLVHFGGCNNTFENVTSYSKFSVEGTVSIIACFLGFLES
jgi:hypothetical protein